MSSAARSKASAAFLCFVFVASAGLGTETASKDRTRLARSKIAKGEELIRQSEFAGAERLFRRALALQESLPNAHLGLAKALVGQGRYEEALLSLDTSEQRYLEWEQRMKIEDLKMRQIAERQTLIVNDMAAAIDTIRNSQSPNANNSLSPGAVSPQEIQTEQFLVRNRWELEGFNAIPAMVFYLQGISYLRTNRRDLGIEALEICLLIDDQHELAHYNLAVAVFTHGELDKAKFHLDHATTGGIQPHESFVADLERALKKRQVAEQASPVRPNG